MKTTIFALLCAGIGILLGVGLARLQLGEAAAFVLPNAGDPSSASVSSIPVARVAVDQERYDFGYMERHTSQSHDFLFTNVGDAPLELTVGETTCKCTIGEVPEKLVEPGETVPVTLSWTAETNEPEFRQSAEIHTNDPLRRHLNLTVVGQVGEASSYYPKMFLFGSMPIGTSQSAVVKVVSTRDEPFEITATEFVDPATEDDFQVAVDELPADEYPVPRVKSGYRVTVTAGPSLPFGQIGGWLRIKTNLDSAAQMDVPLTGNVVVGDFTIHGQNYNEKKHVLNLGQVVGKEGVRRRLLILLHGERGKEMDVSIAETRPEYLRAELGERNDVNERFSQVPLIVSVPPDSPPAVHLGGTESNPGEIVLKTSHASVPELTISVQFTIE